MELRLPPLSSSSPRARDLVAEAVLRMGRDDLADDAASVVSELVANAVMHARTQMVVTVEPTVGGLRLAVADGSVSMPHYSGAHLGAMSGRGLLIIEQLSARWGVDPGSEGGKVVWAEIDEASAPPEVLDVDELLALWMNDSDDADFAPAVVLVSVDINVHDLIASRHETDELVRDLQLFKLHAAARESENNSPQILALAHRVDAATAAFDDARRQINSQAHAAARAGDDRTILRLRLLPSAAPAAMEFVEALEAADALTAKGILLVPPSTQRTRDIRRYYVEAIVEQLART